MAIVYRHRKKGTDIVFYIGIGKTQFRAYRLDRRNRFWKEVVRKYGYEVDILAENISWEEAQKIERELIQYYGRRDLGKGELVNMTDGGDGAYGTVHSDETKRKRADKLRGMKRSKETCERISKALTGKTPSPESREKNRLAHLGLTHDIETRKKISEANKGRVVRDDVKLESSKRNSIYQYQKYTPEGVLIETYDTMYLALLSIGYTKRHQCIYHACNSWTRFAGGYKWKRVKKE